jgi:hypothetical protein
MTNSVQHPVDSVSTNKLDPKERIILESDALSDRGNLSEHGYNPIPEYLYNTAGDY